MVPYLRGNSLADRWFYRDEAMRKTRNLNAAAEDETRRFANLMNKK